VSILVVFVFIGCGEKEKKPPGPNIVATYDNGKITVEDLENSLEQRTKGIKVLAGDSLVPLKDRMPKEIEVYQGMVRDMVLDNLVKRKIKEKQLDNRGNIRHALQHIEEDVTLGQLHEEMHEKDRIPVDELDIQKYYDANRSRFGDKPLYEVRDEIKNILASQKEGEYVKNYIAELKDTATITKNYEVLRLPEPTEDESREYYQKNRDTYKKDEKWRIEQFEIADTTDKAKERGQKAWAKLGSGERFEAVAGEFGVDGAFTTAPRSGISLRSKCTLLLQTPRI